MRYFIRRFVVGAVLLVHAIAWGAHPLITDDTGTQGKEKFQLEVNGQYNSEKETAGGVTFKETGGQVGTTLSYACLRTPILS